MTKYKRHPIAHKVKESEPLPGLRLITMRTSLPEAVTLRGSFLGGSVFSEDNIYVPKITANLLDEGTKNKGKDKIREEIENKGASISFSAGIFRSSFGVTSSKKDLPFILGLLAEELREPVFRAEDFEILRKRFLTNLAHSKEDTREQARRLFLGEIFYDKHPNFTPAFQKLNELLGKIQLSEIKNFHTKNYGLGSMIIVATGDVEHKALHNSMKVFFRGWRSVKHIVPQFISSKSKKYKDKSIFIPAKENVDIYIGAPIGIDDKHEDYDALSLGVFTLGGNFSSRLVSSVREKKGLTYGIYGGLGGASNNTDGYFYVWGTFAPGLFSRGREAALAEIKNWVKKGITQKELNAKKSTIINSFKVGIENSRGLAGIILGNAEDGKPTSYIDEYLNRIESLSLKQVNSAIKKYIDPSKLAISSAGSIKA